MKRNIWKALAAVMIVCLSAIGLFACKDEPEAKTYTVTYAAGAQDATGTAPAGGSFEEGATVTLAVNPFTLEGFTFTGWKEGETVYAAGDSFTMPAKDVTFTAQWQANEPEAELLEVAFDADNETNIVTVEVEKGTAIGAELPADPVKTGYRFDGWYNGTTEITAETVVNEAITATAKWVEQVTVTFDADNGGENVAVTFDIETALGAKLPADPVKTGYRFDGWYNGTTEITAETVVNEAITATAKWVEQVTVTFKLSENDTNPVVISVDINTALGDKFPADPTPESENFVFNGWFEDYSKVTKTTEIEEDIVVTAEFLPLYTVTFRYGDGEDKVVVVKVPEEKNTGIEAAFNEAQEKVNAPVGSQVVWKNADGDVFDNSCIYDLIYENATYTATILETVEDDKFIGAWTGDEHQITVVALKKSAWSSDMVLNAVIDGKYVVTFSTDPLAKRTVASCFFDGMIKGQGSGYYADYSDSFIEYKNGTLTVSIQTYDGPVQFSIAESGKAEVPAFDIADYVGNYQSGSNTVSISYDSVYDEYIAEVNGEEDYGFKTIGSYLLVSDGDYYNPLNFVLRASSDKLEGFQVSFDEDEEVSTFTAVTFTKEVAAEKYSVTFFNNDDAATGTLPTLENQGGGTTVTVPANDLAKAHYSLKWRLQVYVIGSDGSGAWDTYYDENDKTVNVVNGESFTMPAQNIRLLAVWTANDVTVHFNANGGSGEMADTTKPFNTNYSEYASAFQNKFNPPAAGSTFLGWSLTPEGEPLENGTKLDASIVPENDEITLYAVWQTSATTAPALAAFAGEWSNGGGDTLSLKETGDEVGLAVLNGRSALNFTLYESAWYALSCDYDLYYGVSYDAAAGTLTLTSDEGTAIVFTQKTELAQTPDFTGKWLNQNNQAWVITEEAAYYGTNAATAAVTFVGKYAVIVFNESYSYVLTKGESALNGFYEVTEKDPAAVTFTQAEGAFFVLTVEGKFNQIVSSGIAPDAGKIVAPAAPEGKEFDKWVIAGTQTEFDPSAVMTADASITAVFKDVATNSAVKTYTGSYSLGLKKLTKIQLNVETGEATFITVNNSGIESESTATAQIIDGNYYFSGSSTPAGEEWWFVISSDGQTLEIHDDWNGPDELLSTFTLAQ